MRLEEETIIRFFRFLYLFFLLLLLGLEVSGPLIQDVLLLRLWLFFHEFTLNLSNLWALVIHGVTSENISVMRFRRLGLPELQFRKLLLSEDDVCWQHYLLSRHAETLDGVVVRLCLRSHILFMA